MQQHAHCLICGSANLNPLQAYSEAHLARCIDCSFVFCSRIPSNEELAKHYDGYPRATELPALTKKRYHEILERLEQLCSGRRILDVGCGDGHFLEVALERGWKAYGTEFTDDAVRVCRDKGIEMRQGPLSKDMFSEAFDVVTSFEVIEHINNPVAEMKIIYDLLKPGGLFYCTTPNFNSTSRRFLGPKWNVIEYPEHLSYYTPGTLDQLFRNTGLKKTELITSGISVSRFRQSTGSSESGSKDQELRQKAESSLLLGTIKKMLNTILNLSNSGDSLKALYRKD
jgi:2-polyprenyl-3-methyl-5-hydroxy-6-metoxy-1,4-benzoquinol methylase